MQESNTLYVASNSVRFSYTENTDENRDSNLGREENNTESSTEQPISKVKQITNRFNARIAQILQRDASCMFEYSPLDDESMEAQNSDILKRTRYFLVYGKKYDHLPRASSRSHKSRRNQYSSSENLIQLDESFSSVSVTEKVLFYNNYSQNNSQNVPKNRSRRRVQPKRLSRAPVLEASVGNAEQPSRNRRILNKSKEENIVNRTTVIIGNEASMNAESAEKSLIPINGSMLSENIPPFYNEIQTLPRSLYIIEKLDNMFFNWLDRNFSQLSQNIKRSQELYLIVANNSFIKPCQIYAATKILKKSVTTLENRAKNLINLRTMKSIAQPLTNSKIIPPKKNEIDYIDKDSAISILSSSSLSKNDVSDLTDVAENQPDTADQKKDESSNHTQIVINLKTSQSQPSSPRTSAELECNNSDERRDSLFSINSMEWIDTFGISENKKPVSDLTTESFYPTVNKNRKTLETKSNLEAVSQKKDDTNTTSFTLSNSIHSGQFDLPTISRLSIDSMKWINTLNTPEKIKAAYTLTPESPCSTISRKAINTKSKVISSGKDNVHNELFTSKNQSISESSNLNQILDYSNNSESYLNESENFICTPPEKQPVNPFETYPDEIPITQTTTNQRRHSLNDLPSRTPIQINTTRSSTPVGRRKRAKFYRDSLPPMKWSPINKLEKKIRGKRLSTDFHRNSIPMEVIEEEKTLDKFEAYSPLKLVQPKCYRSVQRPNCFYISLPTDLKKQKFRVNSTSLPPAGYVMLNRRSNITTNNNTNITRNESREPTSSKFWIKNKEWYIALDINYVDHLKLRQLHSIYMENGLGTTQFGIDDQLYTSDYIVNNGTRVFRTHPFQESSHYWFSCSNLTVPFSGKYMSGERIQCLFSYICSTFTHNSPLRFGVDKFEFSRRPIDWDNSMQKYSISSSYDQLIGLQSGTSNGLEGRSKHDWPCNSSPRVSNISHQSYAPFSQNSFDLSTLSNDDLMLRRKSSAMMNSDAICGRFQNEPLDKLFERKCSLKIEETKKQVKKLTESKSFKANQVQKRFNAMYKNIKNPKRNSNLTPAKEMKVIRKGFKNDLKILKKIQTRLKTNGIKNCSKEELEDYIIFLSDFAEVSLGSCLVNMDDILEVLCNSSKFNI